MGFISNEYFNAHYEGTNKIRGEIIISTIALEKIMDELIVRYFCHNKNKRVELLEIIVSERMDFMKKADAVCEILNRHCNKHQKIFKNEYPGFLKDFQDIAKDRNRFAHQFDMPLTKEEFRKHYVIVFMPFKNGVKRQGLTHLQVRVIIDRIQTYTDKFDFFIKSHLIK